MLLSCLSSTILTLLFELSVCLFSPVMVLSNVKQCWEGKTLVHICLCMWWKLFFIIIIIWFLLTHCTGGSSQLVQCVGRFVRCAHTHWCPLVHWRTLAVYVMHFKKIKCIKAVLQMVNNNKIIINKNYLNCSSGLWLLPPFYSVCVMPACCA